MKTQHSPGDWNMIIDRDEITVSSVDRLICQLTGDPDKGTPLDEEDIANMRLAAAAPKLLAACLAMREGWQRNLTEPMTLVNAAIAIALGDEADAPQR